MSPPIFYSKEYGRPRKGGSITAWETVTLPGPVDDVGLETWTFSRYGTGYASDERYRYTYRCYVNGSVAWDGPLPAKTIDRAARRACKRWLEQKKPKVQASLLGSRRRRRR